MNFVIEKRDTMYQYKSRVRYSEVNSEQKLTLLALTDYFQDCCTFQSEDLGVGMDYLKNLGGAWILSSWEIIIKDLPKVTEAITTCTWPCDFKGFYGTRNFCLKNEEEETLAFANSLWVYMNINSKRPAKIAEPFLKAYEKHMDPQIDYPWSDRKIKVEGTGVEKEPVKVAKYFIDTNHHMNNGKYIMVAAECLPEEFQPHRIRVEYRKAAVLGDVLLPIIYEQSGCITVVLADEEKKPYAVVQFLE